MNAAGLQGDLETMIHEAGHAFHSIYCGHLELIGEKLPNRIRRSSINVHGIDDSE